MNLLSPSTEADFSTGRSMPRYAVWLLTLTFMLFVSAPSWPCSCNGTTSIGTTIATIPTLVEARVDSVSSQEVTLSVSRTLKGASPKGSIVAADSMCYKSLYPSIMKPGHTYVLPLLGPFAGPDHSAERQSGIQIYNDGPKAGEYEMAGCADSGFELIEGQLYTFEQTTGADRKLRGYGSYASFRFWRPGLEIATMMTIFIATAIGKILMYAGPAITLLWLALCIIAIVLLVKLGPERRRRVVTLTAALPAIWILIGLWGCVFRETDLYSLVDRHEMTWKVVPPVLGTITYFCFAALYVRRTPTARIYTTTYSVANAPFVIAMALIAIMAINGSIR